MADFRISQDFVRYSSSGVTKRLSIVNDLRVKRPSRRSSRRNLVVRALLATPSRAEERPRRVSKRGRPGPVSGPKFHGPSFMARDRASAASPWIGQRPIRPGPGRRRQMRLLEVAGAENVEHLLAGGDQIIRDDAAMASPPDRLGAHDARARRMAQARAASRGPSGIPRSSRSRRNCESWRCPRTR